MMTKPDGKEFIRLLRFPPEIEQKFQTHYYHRVRATLRFCLCMMAGLNILWSLSYVFGHQDPEYSRVLLLAASLTFGLSLGLLAGAFHPKFIRYWQPVVVMATLAALAAPLVFESFDSNPSTFFYLCLIFLRVQRLQFRWMALQLCGVLLLSVVALQFGGIGNWIGGSAGGESSGGGWSWQPVIGFILLESVLLLGPLFWTLRVERFERREFLTKYLLTQERDEEREKREHSEKMLHVLSQAIGGIVHDLGNPLTAVQGGAQTLSHFLQEDEPDKETILEFVDMITDGARMLNYLRLSLIEQTRVLEGEPVPLERTPIAIRNLAKAGAHYQKPRYSNGRLVSFEGEDLELCVDEMRFTTVLMNLIGNALKYSDGEVRIIWRIHGDLILIAVQDQGQKAKGISQVQAEKLFVPFGRLDAHAKIEGTGLGLLSAKSIAEAHGGELYIEGYVDGTQESASFCTAKSSYPSTLEAGFRTAFIAACPLKSAPCNVP